MWGDNMSRITSYGKQSITDLLGKMNQAENAINQADKTEDGKSTKKDKSKVFAGDLNLIDDPVTERGTAKSSEGRKGCLGYRPFY
mgnify:CR=1 FL=1